MVSVRADCTKILTHLIQTVGAFGSDSKHPVNICFTKNQISTIDDFESLEIDDIDALTYHKTDDNDGTTSVERLPPGNRGNLRHLLRYVKLVTAQYFESNAGYPPYSHWYTQAEKPC